MAKPEVVICARHPEEGLLQETTVAIRIAFAVAVFLALFHRLFYSFSAAPHAWPHFLRRSIPHEVSFLALALANPRLIRLFFVGKEPSAPFVAGRKMVANLRCASAFAKPEVVSCANHPPIAFLRALVLAAFKAPPFGHFAGQHAGPHFL